jgi:hypothetical protein
MIRVILAGLLAAAATAGGPGEEKLFGNWAVTCDNVKRCEATVLMPQGWQPPDGPKLDLVRDAGPAGSLFITISPETEAPGLIDILIDRHLMGSGVMRGGSVHLTGATAEGIARAMATGRVLSLRSRRKTLMSISLTGSSAAMRHIDTEQGRAGGVTALVARGPKGAAAVPAAIPVPQIRAVRPGKGKPATLTAAQIEPLRQLAGCDAGQGLEAEAPQFHRLDGHSALLLFICHYDLRGSGYAAFVVSGGKAMPAQFDFAPDSRHAGPVAWLIDPQWEGDAGLTMFRWSGDLGDCGSRQNWVWDGSRFRLTYYNGLEQCRRSGNRLKRYRAEAVYK